jgi:hypothetical protein
LRYSWKGVEDSVILEYDTTSLDYWSRCVTIMILFRSPDLEDEGSMFLQNIRNLLPHDMASHPNEQSSSTIVYSPWNSKN